MTAALLPDAFAAALGKVLARARAEWRSERELAQAETRRAIAELEARVATLTLQLHQMVSEKLAELKDGPPGPTGERGEPGPQGEAIVGPRGEPGPPGADSTVPGPPGPEPYVGEVCGLYEPGRDYRKFDLVTLNGSEWRARGDNPGALPGEGWALAGQSGSRGRPGERGERGISGPPGPAIIAWETRDYRIVPVMSDGSVGPPLDLREFFASYDAERAA